MLSISHSQTNKVLLKLLHNVLTSPRLFSSLLGVYDTRRKLIVTSHLRGFKSQLQNCSHKICVMIKAEHGFMPFLLPSYSAGLQCYDCTHEFGNLNLPFKISTKCHIEKVPSLDTMSQPFQENWWMWSCHGLPAAH